MSTIDERLMSSAEYAGDDAVPQVAHDAQRELWHLRAERDELKAECDTLRTKLLNALGAEERANERCCDVEDERDTLRSALKQIAALRASAAGPKLRRAVLIATEALKGGE